MNIEIENLYLVPFDGSFSCESAATAPPEDIKGKKSLRRELSGWVKKLQQLQRIFYAHDHHSILLVFQAMDAAGKDGTIRAVVNGVNTGIGICFQQMQCLATSTGPRDQPQPV